MSAGNFTITVNQANKTFKCVSNGVFSLEMIAAFEKDFLDKVKTIDPKCYDFSNDTRNLQTASAEVGKALVVLMAEMLQYPFKKFTLPKSKNAIAHMQLIQLGKNIPGWDKVDFVDDFD
jgi:hypothetical protein